MNNQWPERTRLETWHRSAAYQIRWRSVIGAEIITMFILEHSYAGGIKSYSCGAEIARGPEYWASDPLSLYDYLKGE